jgi:hypothetical protein
MRTIPLVDGRGKTAKVDDEDYAWLSKYTWRCEWCARKRTHYAVRDETEDERKARGGAVIGKVYMHDQIMQRMMDGRGN